MFSSKFLILNVKQPLRSFFNYLEYKKNFLFLIIIIGEYFLKHSIIFLFLE